MQGECSDHACEGIAEPKSWDACIPIVNKTLWIKSGHADKYNENMFKTMAGDVEMAVKPMNCPCHIQIFNTGLRSWRDLPMRLAEFGKCHRYEPAGTMHGLMRVRGFVQDDAHIFCTEDQIASEVADFCALVKESEQAECRDKMLALRYFGMTEAQPRTPKASNLPRLRFQRYRGEVLHPPRKARGLRRSLGQG